LAVLRPVTFHDDIDAEREIRFAQPAAEKSAGAAEFDRPVDGLAIVAFHVEENPTVWVDPVELRQRAFQRYRLVDIELSRERMMRKGGYGGKEEPHREWNRECQ